MRRLLVHRDASSRDPKTSSAQLASVHGFRIAPDQGPRLHRVVRHLAQHQVSRGGTLRHEGEDGLLSHLLQMLIDGSLQLRNALPAEAADPIPAALRWQLGVFHDDETLIPDLCSSETHCILDLVSDDVTSAIAQAHRHRVPARCARLRGQFRAER